MPAPTRDASRGSNLVPQEPLSLAYAAIFIVYLLLQVRSYSGVFHHDPVLYADSIKYLRHPSAPLTSYRFWHHDAWGLALFYKLIPGSLTESAPVAQWLVSIASWTVLALVVSRFIRHRGLAIVSFALVLAFSLAPLVSQWNAAILTESFSVSTSVLTLAATLAVLRKPTMWRVLLATVAALLSCATRDTNALFVAAVFVAGAAALLRGRRGVALALIAGLIACFASSASVSGQAQGSVANNLALRILSSPSATAYFVARGLPYRVDLASIILEDHASNTFNEDPALAHLRVWLDRSGNSAYTHYLLTHPDYSVATPLRNLPAMISPSRARPVGLDFFRQPGFRDGLPVISDILYPSSPWLVIGWILVVLAAAGAFAGMKLASAIWLVPVAMIASVVPQSIVVWDADPFAIDRHSLLIGVVARLGLWILALFVVDAALSSGRAPPHITR